MKFQIVLYCFIFSFFGCNSQPTKEEITEGELTSVKISPNDSQLVFSYFINDVGSIYTCDLEGRNVKLIAQSQNKETYSKPVYSPDGKMILFLSFSTDGKSSAIFLMNNKGENKVQLTPYVQLITEVAFCEDNINIVYCKAKEFGNYSPIAPKASHNMDIYMLDSKKTHKQLTHINSYSIENLVIKDSTAIFLQNLEGLYYFKLKQAKKIEALTPKNKEEIKTIGCGGFSIRDETLFFLTGGTYQLFMMNLQEKQAQLVMHNRFQIANLNAFHNSDKILFTKNNTDHNAVVVYDLNQHTYKEVSIRVNN